MAQERIYLDAVAGQPWLGQKQILPAAAGLGWSHPSGIHFEASRTRAVLETSIASLAAGWGVPSSAIVPVHNLGNAFALAAQSLSGEVRFSPLSRLGAIQATKAASPTAAPLSVDSDGYVRAPESADWLVIQAGNHEVGSVDDFSQFAGSRLLVDATEWAGRMTISPGGDVIVTRSSSWGGPHSVCFVVFMRGTPDLPARKRQMLAPEPVLVALAVSALEQVGDVAARGAMQAASLTSLRTTLADLPGVSVHGDFERARLPHILSFSVEGVDSEALSHELDKRGFAVGSGSACSVEGDQPSHVLAAMGIESHGNIRVSLPLDATPADIEAFAVTVPIALDAVRA